MNINLFGIGFTGTGIIVVIVLFLLGRELWHRIVSMVLLTCILGGAYLTVTHHFTKPSQLFNYVTEKGPSTVKKIPSYINHLPSVFDNVLDNFQNVTDKITNADVIKPETNTIKQPANPIHIQNQLVDYTESASSGPTKNYYWFNGKAKLQPDKDIVTGMVKYSIDNQGRAGLARGKLTYEMYQESKGKRQGNPLKPDGWPQSNPKVAIKSSLTNRTYHGYFYNRSHSIADSLAGAQSYASYANFTTGSRTQNVGANQNGGMRAAEELAEKYWQQYPNSKAYIHYQVRPIYLGIENIPRGSIVDEKSSDGKLNREIIVINSAQGYHINYNTGVITLK